VECLGGLGVVSGPIYILLIQTLFDLYFQIIKLSSDISKDLEYDNLMETTGIEELNPTVTSWMNVIQRSTKVVIINRVFPVSDNAKPWTACNSEFQIVIDGFGL
jgi:hypothetical protein